MKLRPVWWVLILSIALVGGRSLYVARSVLVAAGPRGGGPAIVGLDPAVAAVARQDSMLAVRASDRDPFRTWQPPVETVVVTPARSEPEPPAPPRVSVYLDDGASRSVQIEVDGETSGRLGEGGSFRGWTITGISPGGVVVVRNGQRFVLPRP